METGDIEIKSVQVAKVRPTVAENLLPCDIVYWVALERRRRKERKWCGCERSAAKTDAGDVAPVYLIQRHLNQIRRPP